MLDPEFQLFHQYRRLVRRGKASALTCDVCNSEVYTSFGQNDELVLECFVCGRTITPGLALKNKIRAIVSEYFLD